MQPADSRIRLILFVLGLFAGAQVLSVRSASVSPAQAGESLDGAVRRNVAALLLEARGATVADPERDVVWADAPKGDLSFSDTTGSFTFFALATPPGAPARDLFRLEARVTPAGVAHKPAWIVNLSMSLEADDASLATDGRFVATAVRYGGKVVAIELRDLQGEDPVKVGTAGWTRTRRLGNAITNLEQTGSRAGLQLERFTMDAPADRVSLHFEDGTLVVQTDSKAARVTLSGSSGALKLIHQAPYRKMEYDFLNWLADRGRGLAAQGLAPEWAGSSIELLKEVYFKAQEVKAKVEEVQAEDEPVEVEEAEVVEAAVKKARLAAAERQLPWPPRPLEPILAERTVGEGLWEAIGPDEVTTPPNAPAPFFKTFIRAESEFKTKRVWITVWDPEQVTLRMRAGTHNPVPQTGHKGDGRIPREREHLERVVGGFNGGFQTEHVWYGMMVDKKVLLRPREYGATAGTWADGRTAFGTWKPHAPIPKDLLAYRQNLPPLIEDGVYNPYRRGTWGWHRKVAGAKGGKTIRSALCYTNDGYVMYFYSEFSDEHGLANTLFHCECRYAVHLDMNRGHTGFEYYRRLADDAALDEETGREVEGVRFAGSTLHPTIKHMKAPTRYLGVDYRDFFYLTLRDLIPGADLNPLTEGAADHEGRWRTDGLPHNAEFPPRLASTFLSVGEGQIRVLQLDPRGLRFQTLPGDDGSKQPAPALDTLIGTIPTTPGPRGPSTLTVGGVTLAGQPMDAQVDGPIRATVIGLDRAGFVFVLDLQQVPLEAARKVLSQRAVEEAIWLPLPPATSSTFLVQPTRDDAGQATIIEAAIGETEGVVKANLTRDVPRLMFGASERPSRIVRLFPDMTPRAKKRRGRK